MDRGSDKHNPRLDEEMKHEVAGLVQGGKDTHAEEWASPEPAGEDQPAVDRDAGTAVHGAVPDGMSDADVEGRSQLATYLTPGAFPGVREQLLGHVLDASAPDAVVEEVRALPAGREFTSVGEVWRTLHGGGHVEEHRF
jgi:Protein of unknown function (DUF2795)